MECVERLVQAVIDGEDESAREIAEEVVEKVEDLSMVIGKLDRSHERIR